MRLLPLALLLPQAAQAHGGVQLQGFRLLAAGHVQGPLQPCCWPSMPHAAPRMQK